MKKIKFAKKRRKLFSTILAGAMLTTSVIPESFVWASEEVQEFGDSESLGFGSTSDPMSGAGGAGENQALSDFQDMPDVQNGNDTVDMESGFTDESASFGSNGRDSSVESDFQSLTSVEELQERINALPTVEEFQNLADGTTVEGSTLNQAQTDVYTEAQDIAEKLDLLSEEEQGLVDVSRLEALFGYFNGMTEELADTNTISPGDTISPGNNVTITTGGTYKIAGGTYTAPYKSGVININTTEEVTLEITGNINIKGGDGRYLIDVQNACKELKIINESHLVHGECRLLQNNNEKAIVTFMKGTYSFESEVLPIWNRGVVNLKQVGFEVACDGGRSGGIIHNLDNKDNPNIGGTVYIEDGTRLESHGGGVSCIVGGIVNMRGGTITATLDNPMCNGIAYGIRARHATVVGGTIENFSQGIIAPNTNVKAIIGGKITFKNNSRDILLNEGNLLTINDDFEGTAKIGIDGNPTTFPCQITTPGTSRDMRAKIICNNGPVNYDIDGGYLYIGDHNHVWSYSKNDNNKIIATCTADEDCEHNSGKLDLAVTATNEYFSGNAYTGATVTNNITYATGDKASIIYYLKDGAVTNSSNSSASSEGAAPVNPGNYTVKVTLGGQTISADFKIRTQINPTVTIDGWTYGENANTPKVTVKSGGSDITTSYKEPQITYTYYTDENCTNVTTVANGASADGAVPKNAGTYYVKAAVAENGNNAAGITEAMKFTIARKSVVAFVEAENKTYDGNVSATIKATVKQSELVSRDSITITNLTGTFEDRNAGDDKIVTVDTSEAVISGNGADNYDVTFNPLQTKASIDKRTAEFTWGYTEFIYTGTEHSIEATVNNAISGDQFTPVYTDNKKTEAGNYTAKVTDLGNPNYKLPETEKAQIDWKITYLAEGSASVSGTEGKNDWYVGPVSLVPETGYKISTDKNTWRDSLNYSDQGDHFVTYYLKDANGYITDKKTAAFKIDTEVPTGKIEIGTNTFSGSPNPVAYDYWFRNNAAVDITGADSTSGIASIEYQKVKADESYDVNGTWVTWDAANKLSLTESGKYVIYARITDNAGNQTIINSDGVVVFKDSVVADPSIDYTKTTKTSADAKVTLNGNTVASVKNGQDTLTAGTDYTVSTDKITFRGEYLDTLAVGTYTLTVAYHPQGEIQYTGGDKPAESQIALKVKQKTVNVTYQAANVKITSVLDKEYDGQPADLVYTTNSTASVKVEYNVNGIWQTKAPTYAGTYEVRVSVPGNSYFTAASTTKTYTIKPRGVEISGITANKKVYDGTKNAELDYSKVMFARLIEGDALTVSAEGTFADSNAAKGKTVTITNLVLGGRSASNYVLTADGQQAGTIADINPKRITVTADNLKKIVGGADPVLTYTASGLVGEDTLSGIVVKRKSGEKVGTYAIKVSQKKGSNPNYRITFKKGIFTIQQSDQSKMKGKDIYRLKLPVFFARGKANKNSITLSWKKYAGATGYDVYWSYCDGRINYKKVGTVKSGKLSMSHKKLKKDHEYKYFVAAYKMVEGRKIYIARSNDVHVALKQASTTNAASIKVNRTEIALSVGKTFQLKCSLKAEDSRKDLVSHTSPFRYYTTNSKVATVNKDGVIKAKGKGVCTIYILANNGVYKKVTVTVK